MQFFEKNWDFGFSYSNFHYPLVKPKLSAFYDAIKYEMNNRAVLNGAVDYYGKPHEKYIIPWFLDKRHEHFSKMNCY